MQTVIISKDIAKNIEAAKEIAKEYLEELSFFEETKDAYRFKSRKTNNLKYKSLQPKQGVNLISE